MARGKIRKLFVDQGYGFIEGERGFWFFHGSVVEGTTIDQLQIGQSVEYQQGCGPSGPRADSLRIL